MRLSALLMLGFLLSACHDLGTSKTSVSSRAALLTEAPAVLDDRELIVLDRPPGTDTIARAEALGYRLLRVDQLEELGDVLITLRIPDGTTIPEAIAEIEAASPGVTAGAHHLYTLQAIGLSEFAYANRMIGWPAGGCPAVRRFGMIDAGLPPDDPRLAAGQIVQEVFVDGAAMPDTDHGALMADLMIGPGRLTGAPLYSAVAVDPGLKGGETAGVSAILRSVNWFRAQGVDLVNISLAGPRNKLLNRGLGQAAADGMIMVAAAGNLGPDAPPQFPAAFPFVIAVTAVDAAGAPYDRAVQGDHIDIAAPGVDILLETAQGTRLFSGTSAAAPFVTSAIATDPRLIGRSVGQVRIALANRATDLGRFGDDPVFGAGLVSTPPACGRGS